MKITPVPSRAELVKAYEFLQSLGVRNKSTASPREIVRWTQWCRLDARLAELLVRYIANSFSKIDPFQLWRANETSAVPQALAVLAEFVRLELRAQNKGLREFDGWCSAAIYDLSSAPPQMFFLRDGLIRPDLDYREIQRSLKIYLKWGFFGSDEIVTRKDDSLSGKTTFLKKPQRAAILNILLSKNKTISVEDYIQASGGKIHRRTAERDLAAEKNLKQSGFTRGRRYSLMRA